MTTTRRTSSSKVAMYLILAASSLVLFYAIGTRQGFGLFLSPMSKELQWGREVFSIAIGLQNLLWGASQPFIGAIADRYGPGRVVAVGAAFYALGLYLMGTTTSQLELYVGAGFVVGISLSAVSFAVVFGAVARAVPPERQGMALGIAGAVGSAGQFVMVIGLSTMIEKVDQWIAALGIDWLAGMSNWRATLVIFAIGAAVIVIPLAYPLRRRKGAGAGGPPIQGAESLRAALREAFGHQGFLLLNAGFFVCGFHVTFIATHLPAYIGDFGLPLWVSGTALALVGGFNVIGSFVCGSLGDKYRKKYLLSLLYLARAAVIAGLLLAPPTATTMLVFGAGIGLLWLGTVPLTSALVAQIFGVRYMATLFGIVFFCHQIGAFLGVWLGGKLYDMTGSYDVVWLIAIGLGVAAAIIHWPIADKPVERPAAAAA